MILDGFLSCSCKTYERYGYPCHHLLHVLKATSTHDIKKEWIHIRWSKDYLVNHFHPNTTNEQLKLYSYLYHNHPVGIKFISNSMNSYPVFTPSMQSIHLSMFNVPSHQFLSRTTKSLWIEANKSDDANLNKLLHGKISNMIEHSITLSQEQKHLNDLDNIQFENSNDDSDITDNETVKDYNEQFALFKRAHALCSDNIDDHKEFHSLLTTFVRSKEINHNDNVRILGKRNHGETVMISSNKIVNKKKRSTKRTKAGYEKS